MFHVIAVRVIFPVAPWIGVSVPSASSTVGVGTGMAAVALVIVGSLDVDAVVSELSLGKVPIDCYRHRRETRWVVGAAGVAIAVAAFAEET